MNLCKGKTILLTIFILIGQTLLANEQRGEILLKNAEQTFRQALNLKSGADGAQKKLFQQAAILYTMALEEPGLNRARLSYNIGNCYYLSDKLGPAILFYRRAQKGLPGERMVLENLRFARRQQKDQLIYSPALQAWHLVRYSLNYIPYRTILYISGSLYILFWLSALWRLKSPESSWANKISGISIFVMISGGALAGTKYLVDQRCEEGVVLAQEVVARKGYSEFYEPTFTAPLHAGAEFKIITEKKDWYEIELPNGTTCWIPTTSAARI